jgi:ATP-binding cassette subfamily B protein
MHGEITIGTFFAFSSYLASFVGPVRMLSTPDHLRPAGAGQRHPRLRGHRLQARHHRQAGRRRAAERGAGHRVRRRHLRLPGLRAGAARPGPEVRHGETVAVIGTSGSGKSTIACCCRASTTSAGGSGADRRVRRPGRDRPSRCARSIGLVMEEAFLFSDSVSANIAYGRPDATDEQVIAAAKAAEADRVHRGAAERLRHGRRRAGPDPVRRPAPARRPGPRADHRPADLLLLDDATSAVDAPPRPRSTPPCTG